MPTSLLVCLLVVAQTQLQGPTQGPGEHLNKQQAHTRDTAQASRQDQHGTADSPLVVHVLRAPRNQEDLAREARDRREDAARNWQMVVWTAVMAVTTVALAVFNGINLWMLRKQGKDLQAQRAVMQSQADHTEKQAEATQASVAQMKDTSERQLRAYLSRAGRPGFRKWKHVSGGTRYEFRIPIKNTGLTPAYDVSAKGLAEVLASPPQNIGDLLAAPAPRGSVGPLGHGEVMEVTCISDPLDANQTEWMVKGKWILYLYGRVTYRDAFGHSRYIEFCEGVLWHRATERLGASDVDTYPAECSNEAD